mmetsp:Transcript_13514/g.19332  ORF Transcript_13514/g.19332 Transcript_13514/m.19332 type:complete len:238 (+) Transcript_13514:64-777(+)
MIGSATKLSTYIHSQEWSIVLKHIDNHNRDARIWFSRPGFFDGATSTKVLPIHEAVALNCPLEVLLTLHEAYPDGTRMREVGFQRNILHIACRNDVSLELMRLIIKLFPDSANEEDKLGRVPLHYSCNNGSKEENVDLLLEACKNSVRCFDRRGWYPLHIACSLGASPSVVQKLVDGFPLAATVSPNKTMSTFDICDMAINSANTSKNKAIILKAVLAYEKSKPRPPRKPTSERNVV